MSLGGRGQIFHLLQAFLADPGGLKRRSHAGILFVREDCGLPSVLRSVNGWLAAHGDHCTSRDQDTGLTNRKLLYFFTLTRNYQTGKKKKIPFNVTLKKIKYLETNLIKEVKDLYAENYKILKMKMIQRNGKISHALGLEELILFKWPYWDFPGGPVVKNLPSNAGDEGSILVRGTKIPHTAGQLSLGAVTREACTPQ